MADSNYGKELASLDFKNLNHRPLSAGVEAQALAAESTVQFIKNLGFYQEGKPLYVIFKYPKRVSTTDKEGKEKTETETMELQVPFLSLIPIPFIRVEEATIDFNAKINAIEHKEKTTDMSADASLKFKQRWIGGSVGLKASFSYKSSTNSGNKVERTYTMAIHVRAVQDEIPGGMEKLLGILESAIEEKKSGTEEKKSGESGK